MQTIRRLEIWRNISPCIFQSASERARACARLIGKLHFKKKARRRPTTFSASFNAQGPSSRHTLAHKAHLHRHDLRHNSKTRSVKRRYFPSWSHVRNPLGNLSCRGSRKSYIRGHIKNTRPHADACVFKWITHAATSRSNKDAIFFHVKAPSGNELNPLVYAILCL